MVVALGPGKFYGSQLPRPRIYTDVKFNDYRVDPPIPVTDPLMAWAEEAHWSMGGLSFQRHRLQGRIEGNVKKLRAEREKILKKFKTNLSVPVSKKFTGEEEESAPKKRSISTSSPSPPPANKRRRYLGLVDDDEEDEGEREPVRKFRARKLSEDFERVAVEREKRSPPVASRTRSQRCDEKVVKEEIGKVKKLRKMGEVEMRREPRSSPRLVKRSVE